MKARKKNDPPSSLRKKAEKKFQDQTHRVKELSSQDMQRLIHELGIHQIELEMQNEELRNSRQEVEDLLNKYTELYDFAPVGYYTLDKDGLIVKANLAGAGTFKIKRGQLIGRRFDFLISPESRREFTSFRHAISGSDAAQTCEVNIRTDNKTNICAQIKGSALQNSDQIQIIVTDITERKRAEEIRGRLSAIVEGADDAIISKDLNSNILTWNAGAETIFGFKAGEVINKNISFLLPPGHEYEVHDIIGKIVQGEHIKNFETERLHKNGTIIPVSLTFSPIRNAGGKVIGVSKISHDITERKRSMETIRLSEARLESLVKISQYKAKDVRDLLEFVLDEAIRLTGSKFGYMYHYNAERREFTLNNWSSNVMKECSIVHKKTLYHLDKTGIWGEAVRQRRPIIINDFQAPHLLKKGYPDGHAQLYKFMTIPIIVDDAIVGVVGLANKSADYDEADVRQLTLHMDAAWKIVDRKRMEEELQKSERRYHSLFEKMLDGFAYCKMLYDDQGRPADFVFLEVNPSFERLTGLKNVAGKKISEAIPGTKESHPELFEIYGRVASTGGSDEFEIDFKPLGAWYAISVYSTEREYFTIIFENITERKLVEKNLKETGDKVEAANKELEAFSYSVSHDLRAPLRHMTGFVQLLQKRLADHLDDKTHDHMAAIAGASKKMGILIDDLLAFSHIGHAAMQVRKVGLSALVNEVVGEMQVDVQGRDIVWDVGALPDVYGDKSLLRLVLVNLISNSVKYTSTRSRAEIRIGCKDEGREIICSVKDNGVGFDMKYADRLFGVFQRLHTQYEFEGTGIGLANVRRIISRHGGRTWGEGAVGEGATFYFTLPKTKEI